MANTGDPLQTAAAPQWIADRYRVIELLGRGGMASVYRVEDDVNGRQVALKQLEASATARPTVASLFEREFHTLAQLRHPHVIAVYDYGLVEQGPYYTMELLDGGDLRDRAPLPWRAVCRLLFDVCSSLALLHSRRLLHRDISPRNIRCAHDGHAKLIDFGAMAPMSSGGADVVGTPAFVAPETVHRLALDARTDLFSLGVCLYHALTGHLPYPARTFADAMAAWNGKPPVPSAWAADIPAALDDLVLRLIQVEPALRPPSAFEVMQRLAAIAGLEVDESEAVSRAYLATPVLVGREGPLELLRERLLASRMARGEALRIEGPSGVGRSRLLDACALEAKTLGFTVLRAAVSGTREPFSTARGLSQHLLEALPSAEAMTAAPELLAMPAADSSSTTRPSARPVLRDFEDHSMPAQRLQQAIVRFWWDASRTRPLFIAVDDVHRIDTQSAAVLAALLDRSRSPGIFVALTIDSDEPDSEASIALARRCAALQLEPLTQAQTHDLLGSLFGDVPNVGLLAHEIHAVAQGNPRQSMELAQHLIDRGVLRYASGSWTLPARLSPDDLPRSAAAAIRVRIERLSRHARFLAEAQALAFWENLRDADYRALLPELSTQSVEQALAELLEAGALVGNGTNYTLANRLWRDGPRDGLSPDECRARHRALAALYRGHSETAFIYHTFAGGLETQGLDALTAFNAGLTKQLNLEHVLEQNVTKMMVVYRSVFEIAERHGKSARELSDLRRWHVAAGATLDGVENAESVRLWRAQLEHDAGLDLYRADPDTADPMQRLMRALQAAQQRYLDTPEAERVYTVEEAIRLLAEYVVFGIATGGRTHDAALLAGLPSMLEPYVALSPMLDAIWRNARATHISQVEGDFQKARALWLEVLDKLASVQGDELAFVDAIGNAVAFAIGVMEGQLGLPTASRWADRLEQDPFQRLSALQLRRIARLQQGDLRGAERLRRQAEVLSLQQGGAQMFQTLIAVEMNACAKAGDLTGVQDAIERMRPLGARYPGWVPNLLYAEANFHLVRGDHEAARIKAEACIQHSAFDARGHSISPTMWTAGHIALAEALLGLERAQQARQTALHALAARNTRQPGGHQIELAQVLTLAEAKLGEPGAAERLEAAIEQQVALGVSGLQLGLSYEARAQIAIWQGDVAAFDRYAALAAREYRHGAGSGLGARYDRLLNEARRCGLQTAAAPLPSLAPTSTLASDDLTSIVSRTMALAHRAQERAQAALQLICSAHQVERGHLYLTSPAGLVLSASQGAQAPLPELDELQAFVARSEDRAAAMDDMATDELPQDAPAEATLEADGVQYALMLLSCLVDGETKLAGLAAIVANDSALDALRRSELLTSLAKHLLHVGDSTGVVASA